MSYAIAKKVSFDQIPVVDLGPIQSAGATSLDSVARQIHDACTAVGFFYVRNHGVPLSLVERTVAMSHRFYGLAESEKAKVKVNKNHRGWIAQGQAKMKGAVKSDLKESFKYGLALGEDDPDVRKGVPLTGPNIWPPAIPEMQATVYPYFQAVMGCGRTILSATAVGLGLASDFFSTRYTKPMARGGLLYYPPQPPEMGADQFGVASHTDYGCLTVLWQDDSGGLQVQNLAGEWIEAPPIPGTFVINVGDLLARWSNDRFASTPHRVINRSGHARYSITTFFDPSYEVVVDPRDCDLPAGMAPRYEPITAGQHVLGRFDGSFAYRQ